MSEAGFTEVLPAATATVAPAAYFPPDPSLSAGLMPGNQSESCEACTAVSLTTERATSRHSAGAASAGSAGTFQTTMSAMMPPVSAHGGADMQTLPRLELMEPTVVVKIIEVQVPWLFWVQRHSKKQELEDILDRLE